MSKNWNLYEKIIGALQIVWGFLIISFLAWTVYNSLERIVVDFDMSWRNISFYKLFKNHHSIFFSGLLGVISGILLLKSKKIGWITSVASWIIYSFGIILFIWTEHINGKELFKPQTDYIITYVLVILYLSLGISLIAKPFRLKYKANISTWISIGLIVLFFALDKILIN